MHRSQNNFSTKHKQYRRNTQYLVTATEANINSPSDEWQFTTAKNRQLKDKSHTSAKGVETLNEQILQEINSLFISEEEGMIIRHNLELNRKGKINANNSFELPIKVIDPKCTERNNAEFWRFASEMLCSSTIIYDKRVDNLYLTSNKITSQLLRVKQKDQFNEQVMNKTHAKQKSIRKSSNQNLFISGLDISIDEVKFMNNEFGEKINLNEVKRDFCRNEVLLINLKGVDQNTNSGLMLNNFEMGSDLRIELFRSQVILNKQETIQDKEAFFVKQIAQHSDSFFYFARLNSDSFFYFARLNSFTQIGRYRDKHLGTNLQQDFQQMFQSMSVNNQKSQKNQSLISINSKENNPTQFWNNNFSQIDSNSHTQDSRQTSYSEQQRGLFSKSIYTQLQDITTIAGPWEVQFKQRKLQKKRKNRNVKKRVKKTIDQSDQSIDFLSDVPLIRKEIFGGIGPESMRITSLKKYDEKYLLPKTIYPHFQIDKQKRSRKLSRQQQNKSQKNKIQQIQQVQVDYESAFSKTLSLENIQQNPNFKIEFQQVFEAKFQQQEQDNQSYQTRTQHTSGIKNIRQIKQLVFMNLTRQSSIKISQIQYELTPAETLIIFLHLANQKNLSLHSIDSQCDVQLFIKQ